MKPRVLFLAPQPFFQWRGSPIRVGFDVQALAELGLEVDLLTLPIGEERSIPGVRILRVANPFKVKNVPIGPSLHKAVFDVFILFKALQLAIRNRYAVIHAVEETALIGCLVGALTGAKVIFEKHSDPASHEGGSLAKNIVMRIYRFVENLGIRCADAVIATGESLVEQTRRISPRKPIHHIFDIPSSLVESDPSRVEALSTFMRWDPSEVLALYVGSFATYQGIDLMFDSMPRVIQERPETRFLVIGGSIEEVEERKAWATSKGIAHAVRFLGRFPPDQLPDYLVAADILLSPRLTGKNTPLKLLDYLKAGRAIVATDNDANRFIVDESCAVLTPMTAEGFAEGIIGLVRDPGRREALGRCGKEFFERKYSYRNFRASLASCYADLGVAVDKPSDA